MSEKSISISTPTDFRLSGKNIVVRYGAGWEEATRIAVLELPSLSEKWSRVGKCHYYDLATGPRAAVILYEVTSEGYGIANAFDLNGTHLFSKEGSNSYVLASPNGEYFCTQYSHDIVNRFNVYDRAGDILFAERGNLGEWYAAPVNDSIVAIFGHHLVTYLRARTGELVAQASWPSQYVGGYPTAYLAKDGGWMFAHSYLEVGCFSPELTLAWGLVLTVPPLDAAFSTDGRFVAFLSGRDNVYTLDLRDSRSGQKIWSEEIRPRRRVYSSEISQISFAGGFISVRSYGGNNQTNELVTTEAESFLFRLDTTTGGFIERGRVDGIVDLTEIDGQIYTATVYATRPEVLSVEGWARK